MISRTGATPYLADRSLKFKAGKTIFFSDFDGTYMLFSQDKCCKTKGFLNDPTATNIFKKIYGEFDKYLRANKSNFEFIVTSGRNKHEFLYFIKKLTEQGLKLPLPAKLIVKNGGDIFKISENGQKYIKPDLLKREEIKLNSNWPGTAQVKSLINNIFKDEQFKLITKSKSNNNAIEYGEISLENHLKTIPAPGKDYYASFRDDGALGMHIALPKWAPGEKITDKIKHSLDSQGIKAEVNFVKQDYCDAVIPHYNEGYKDSNSYYLDAGQSITITPKINDSAYQNNGTLDKIYDIRKSMKDIIDNDKHDLLIIAGNASNDKKMLDPYNYVDLIGLQKPKNAEEKALFSKDPAYMEKMKKLPMASIVVGDDSSLNEIRELAKNLNTDQVKKVIAVDGFNNTLLDAIKNSKESYAIQDTTFAKTHNL